jgi:hypothetical protein
MQGKGNIPILDAHVVKQHALLQLNLGAESAVTAHHWVVKTAVYAGVQIGSEHCVFVHLQSTFAMSIELPPSLSEEPRAKAVSSLFPENHAPIIFH